MNHFVPQNRITVLDPVGEMRILGSRLFDRSTLGLQDAIADELSPPSDIPMCTECTRRVLIEGESIILEPILPTGAASCTLERPLSVFLTLESKFF